MDYIDHMVGHVAKAIYPTKPDFLGQLLIRSLAAAVFWEPMSVIGTTIPHSDFGDPECCGCLNGIEDGDVARIVCNECAVVVRMVPAADLQKALDAMELEMDFATAKCPHCGAVNILTGFTEMIAFICKECGASNS
jgi:phage FluMu protein Com